MKTTTILGALLVVSVLANIALITVSVPQQSMISSLVQRTNTLGRENTQLHTQLNQENTTLQNYQRQLGFFHPSTPGVGQFSSGFITASASLQAPAVMQEIVGGNDNGYDNQIVVENGTMMNISVEIRPGEGRVLVQTTPLMGIVFEDAANTAVSVAENRTGINLVNSDVIFSVDAQNQISSVDGPSAGALMTLITIAALENKSPNPAVTLTGTIDPDGHVGAIGGIIEKATAAKESGKTLILLPQENQRFVTYSEQTTNLGGFELIEQVPQQIDTKSYLENTVGINVTFVNSIDDVINDALP